MVIESIFLKHHQWSESKGIRGKNRTCKKELRGLDRRTMDLSCAVIADSYVDNSFLANNDMSDCYFLGSSFDETILSECILSKTVFGYASLKIQF